MKIYHYIASAILLLLVLGCGENAPGCLKASGDRISEEIQVAPFQRIIVYENVRLVLLQGPEPRVVIQTGKNLRPKVTARVTDGVLELRDENNCNVFREYGETVIRVTTPDLVSVRSSTGWPIISEGVLRFSDISLISESFNNPEAATNDGSFDLDLEADRVRVVVNGIVNIMLRGSAELFEVTIAAGDTRIDARELRASRVRVDHRGSNAILVHPIDRIEGLIRGYGDVRSFNRPPEVEVDEIFRGRLIFVEE